MWVAMRRRFRNADLDDVRGSRCTFLGPAIHCTYTGLGWPQKPPGPIAPELPCHLMFPWSCADTDSFTFSMGRWSSKIRQSICKSASLNTGTPVCRVSGSTSEGRKSQEVHRAVQIPRTSAGPLSPHASRFSSYQDSICFLPDEFLGFLQSAR